MNDIYGRDYLALSGRLYSYSVTQGDGASAFALGCYAPGFQPGF